MNHKVIILAITILCVLIGCSKVEREFEYDLSKIDCWNAIIFDETIRSGNLDVLNNINQEVSVCIEFKGNLSSIEIMKENGIKPRTVSNNIIVAEAPLNKILKLTTYDFITRIKVLGNIHPKYIPKDKNKIDLIIGVIDVGFGFQKEYFDNRIFSYWDQTISTVSSYAESNGLFYGLKYGKEDILNKFSFGKNPFAKRHGSYCTMLAAGNDVDWLHTNNISKDEFGTVSASVIAVETTQNEGDIIDAVNYIKSKAHQRGAKCLINLSQSKHNGRHDETSFLSQALNNFISDSCLIIISSGNDGNSLINYQNKQKNVIKIYFNISRNEVNSDKTGFYIHTYLNEIDSSQIAKLHSPFGKTFSLKKGEWNKEIISDGRLTFSNGINLNTKNDNEVVIVYEKIKQDLPSLIYGDWCLEISNNGGSLIDVNSWVVSQEGLKCEFKSKENCKHTCSDISSASKTISVGGYIIFNDSIIISPYTGKNVIDNKITTPNCIAPLEIKLNYKDYEKQGTSFSSPLVVRTIAKIWEKYPNISGSEIRSYIQNKIIVFNKNDYASPSNLSYEVVNWNDIENYFSEKTLLNNK